MRRGGGKQPGGAGGFSHLRSAGQRGRVLHEGLEGKCRTSTPLWKGERQTEALCGQGDCCAEQTYCLGSGHGGQPTRTAEAASRHTEVLAAWDDVTFYHLFQGIIFKGAFRQVGKAFAQCGA